MTKEKPYSYTPAPSPGSDKIQKVSSIRELKARTYTLMIMKFYSCCHRLDGFYWSMLRTIVTCILDQDLEHIVSKAKSH